MIPEHVNPNNYKVEHILYNDDTFSIVHGIWNETGGKCVAMRWNESPTPLGFPHVYGRPMWFVLQDEFARSFLISLLKKKDSDRKRIKTILRDEYSRKGIFSLILRVLGGY